MKKVNATSAKGAVIVNTTSNVKKGETAMKKVIVSEVIVGAKFNLKNMKADALNGEKVTVKAVDGNSITVKSANKEIGTHIVALKNLSHRTATPAVATAKTVKPAKVVATAPAAKPAKKEKVVATAPAKPAKVAKETKEAKAIRIAAEEKAARKLAKLAKQAGVKIVPVATPAKTSKKEKVVATAPVAKPAKPAKVVAQAPVATKKGAKVISMEAHKTRRSMKAFSALVEQVTAAATVQKAKKVAAKYVEEVGVTQARKNLKFVLRHLESMTAVEVFSPVLEKLAVAQ